MGVLPAYPVDVRRVARRRRGEHAEVGVAEHGGIAVTVDHLVGRRDPHEPRDLRDGRLRHLQAVQHRRREPRAALLVVAGLRVVDGVVEPRREPHRVGVVGLVREQVDAGQHLVEVGQVVVAPGAARPSDRAGSPRLRPRRPGHRSGDRARASRRRGGASATRQAASSTGSGCCVHDGEPGHGAGEDDVEPAQALPRRRLARDDRGRLDHDDLVELQPLGQRRRAPARPGARRRRGRPSTAVRDVRGRRDSASTRVVGDHDADRARLVEQPAYLRRSPRPGTSVAATRSSRPAFSRTDSGAAMPSAMCGSSRAAKSITAAGTR